MAPLSVLPGRVRFEALNLVGNPEGSLLIEESLSSVQGVSEVTASHRTGRVLVRFDESAVSRSHIEEKLAVALKAALTRKHHGPNASTTRRAHTNGQSGVGHFVMEMALHAFLPAPLDLLLPAASALRK